MFLISVEIESEDAEWLMAFLTTAKNEKSRRIRAAVEEALKEVGQ